jgi:hypothetical protein
MKRIELVRARPAGMIPFALGVLTFGALAVMLGAGAAISSEAWALSAAVAVAMTGLGIVLFRQPHRLELTPDEVLVSPRFGSPRRWRDARLAEPTSPVRVGLEVAAVTGALALLAVTAGRAGPAQLLLVAAYAHAYSRWRLAPRAVLVDAGGASTTLRLDRFPGAVDAFASRG